MKNQITLSKVSFKKNAALFLADVDGVSIDACISDSWLFARRLGQKDWRRVQLVEPGTLSIRPFLSAAETRHFDEAAKALILRNYAAIRSISRAFDAPNTPEAQETAFVERAVQELEDLGRANVRYYERDDWRRGDWAGATHYIGLTHPFDAFYENPRCTEVTAKEFAAMEYLGKRSAWFGNSQACYFKPLTDAGVEIVRSRLLEFAREYVKSFGHEQLTLEATA